MKSKTASVCDFIISSKFDILAITESWLTDDDRCNRALADIKHTLLNFELHHVPRTHSIGGGVCVIVRKGFSVSVNTSLTFGSFEHIDLTITAKSTSVRLFVVGRPPYSKKNKLTSRMFLADFSTMLECVSNATGSVLLAGEEKFPYGATTFSFDMK